MKKLASLFFSAIFALSGAIAQQNFQNIITDDLVENTKVPSRVDYLVAKPKSEKPTNAIIEVDGEPTEIFGQLKQVSKGLVASSYVIGTNPDTIGLPNKDYTMKGAILYNNKGQKLECLIIDLADCECGPKTDIAFNRDSVTANMVPTHKMIAYLTDVEWKHEGARMSPRIPSMAIDTVDSSPMSTYKLAVWTLDGAICEVFPLELTRVEGLTISNVYEVSLRHGSRFKETSEGGTFDGKLVQAYLVLKQHNEPVVTKGEKKNKHKKRTKI